jgi:hypothetical protein
MPTQFLINPSSGTQDGPCLCGALRTACTPLGYLAGVTVGDQGASESLTGWHEKRIRSSQGSGTGGRFIGIGVYEGKHGPIGVPDTSFHVVCASPSRKEAGSVPDAEVDILILSASFGAGHHQVAAALTQAFAERAPDLTVKTADFFELVSPLGNRLT